MPSVKEFTKVVTWRPLMLVTGHSIAILLVSLYNYNLAHALIEIYTIMVAMGTFLLGYNARKLVTVSYPQLMAVAFLFVGTLDVLHMLAYNSNNLFPGFPPNIADYFALISQLMMAVSLLVITWFVQRRVRWGWLWASYSIVLFGVLTVLFVADAPPAFYLPSGAMTPLKRSMELFILLILTVTVFRFYAVRATLPYDLFIWMTLGMLIMIANQTVILFADRTYESGNILGHLLKLVAFFAFYRAVIHTSITQPFSLLLRVEKEREESLQREIAARTAELHASRERFRRLAERLPDMIYRYRRAPSPHYTYVNPAVTQIFGLTPEEVYRSSHPFSELMPPETLEHWRDLNRDPDKFPWYEPIELHMLRRDGEKIWIEERAWPVYDDAGNLIEVEGIVRNITERKRAEEALRTSEKQFRILYEYAPVPYQSLDADGNIIIVNQAWLDLLGYEQHEVIGKHISNFIEPSSIQTLTYNFPRFKARGEVHDVEFNLVRRDGSIVTVFLQGRIGYDAQMHFKQTHCILFDVTARKKTEAAIRRHVIETEFLYQMSHLLNSSLDVEEVLQQLTRQTRILFEAELCAVCRVNGKTNMLDCWEDAKLWGVIRYEYPANKGLVGRVVASKETLYIANATEADGLYTEPYLKSGQIIPKSVLTVPIKSGKTLHAVLQLTSNEPNRFTEHDIALVESLANTAAVALENSRLYRQAIEDAQTKLTLLKEVNHRVKNNLAAIAGLLYLEQRKLTGTENTLFRQSLQNLISRVRGLSAVHELLSATEWRPVPLRSLCDDIVRATIHAVAQHQMPVMHVTAPEVAIQSEQAHHLALVINELTINSLKHAGCAAPPLKITISASFADDLLKIQFRDNGHGYPSKILAHVTTNGHTGFELLKNIIAQNLRGEFLVYNDNGAVAEISFKPDTLQPIADW